MRVLKLFALCGALVAGGCNDILGDNDGNFAFQVVPINYDPDLTEGVQISVLLRTIELDGVVVLPSACYDVTGDHRMTDNTVTFTVTARSRGTGCPAALQMMQYRAQSLGLSRGTYRMRVIHQLDNGAQRIMAEENVTLD
jgi:hypothetical protein